MTETVMGTFFFDFDSTLYPKESLDEILLLSLDGHPQKEILAQKIDDICKLGMLGKIDIFDSIQERLKLAKISQDTINSYISQNRGLQFPIVNLLENIRQAKHNIYIISNGFKEWIDAICKTTCITPENIIANNFDTGPHNELFLSKSKMPVIYGKSLLIKELKQKKFIKPPIIMVGDSVTDLQVKLDKVADYFIAATYYIKRPGVTKFADLVVNNIFQFQTQVKKLLASFNK